MKNEALLQTEEFRILRERVIDYAYIAFSTLGFIAQIFSTLRAIEFGITPVLYISGASITAMSAITIIRRRCSFAFKLSFLYFIAIETLIIDLYTYGLLAPTTVFVLTMPVLVSFLQPFRAAIKTLLLFILIYTVFAGLICSSAMQIHTDADIYGSNWTAWLVDASILLFCTASLLIIGHEFISTLNAKYKHIEEQNTRLSINERKYRLLFETANDAILLVKDNKFFDCNEKALDLFGGERTMILGRGPSELSPKIQPDGTASEEKALQLFASASNGSPQAFEWQHIRLDGTYFDASISLNLVQFDDDYYYQAVLRDITIQKQQNEECTRYREELEILVSKRTAELATINQELSEANEELSNANEQIQQQYTDREEYINQLKQAQAQLIQSEKMASLGILTSGVAHEINNPLNYIMGAQVGLESYFEDNGLSAEPRISVLMHSLSVGLERAASIVDSLSQFSRDSGSRTERCNIPEIIENCLLVLGSQIDPNIDIVKSFSNDPVYTPGNIGDLHQVFMNVITNAFQAITKKGTITIQIIKQKACIDIFVTDTGCGIDKNAIAHIFDPFYTTKDPGMGTGLGMSIAYNIISEHGGSIKYTSEPGRGTTAMISVPLLDTI